MSAREPKPLHESGFEEHNIVASFAGMDQARGGLHRLEAAGIEGGKISILGPQVEEAEDTTDVQERDARMAGHVGKRTAAGAAAGTAGGAAVGLLAGFVAFGVPGIGPVVAAGLWASAIGGAVAGGSVGGLVAGTASIDASQAWDLTFETVREGRVAVAVHSHDADEIDTAEEALAGAEGVILGRFDRSGRRAS